MADDELSMLPPALRMAAQKSRAPPSKNKSFQRRKEENDALAKVRCQPRLDLVTEEEKRKQIVQRRSEEKAKRESEFQLRQAQEQSKTIMETMTRESKIETLGMSWSRMSMSPTTSLATRKSSLFQKANMMREKIAQLQLDVQEEEKTSLIKEGHTPEIVQKKLDKVEKLLAKESPGTKEYKKLCRKKEQYENELEEMVMQEMQSSSAAEALKQAQLEAADLEEQLQETEEALQAEKEAAEKRKKEEEAAALAAIEEERRQKEAEEEEAAKAAQAEEKEMDDKERIRQERIKEYHRKQAERKAEEEAEKKKAERQKEYQTLKKKLTKVESMIEEAEEGGKDTSKLNKKKSEYISKLEDFDEWQIEVEEQRQREEAKRLRREREEAEKRQKEEAEKARQEALEAERRRKAQEEEERIRRESEEAQRELEEAEREREAEEERLRQERLEAERRQNEEEEERRRQAQEEEERLRQEEEEAAEVRRLEAERKAEEDSARELEELQRRKEAEEAEAQRIEEERTMAKAAEEATEKAAAEPEAKEEEEEDESPPEVPKAKPRLGGGLLAAIQAKGKSKNQDEKPSTPAPEKPSRPAMGGGLLAAIQARGEKTPKDDKEEENDDDGGFKKVQAKPPGGLLAAIAARGGKPASSSKSSPPQTESTTRPPETPEEKAVREEQQKKDAEEREKRKAELREQTKQAEAAAAEEKVRKPPKKSVSQDFLDLRAIPEPHSENTKKLLADLESVEEKQAKYERTLKQNGIAVSEDIPYEVAKDKVTEIQQQMQALASSTEDPYIVQKKMSALEEDFTKYVTAMMLTDEYAEEQRLAEEKWEESVLADNIEALKKVRSHMPVNIRNMTEEELTTKPSPNGKLLPKAMARKFKRTNVLQLLRVNPSDLERMHPSLIEGLRSTGLTLIERRALHEHLKNIGARWKDLTQDPSIERKYTWFMGLKSKFKEMVAEHERRGSTPGPRGMSYDEDYGYTQEAEYEQSDSAKSSLGDSSHHGTNASSPAKRAGKSGGNTKEKDEQLMASIRERLKLDEEESDIDTKLLRELFHAEKRLLSLEKQLTQNGIALPKEDISYAVAKAKVAEIMEDIKEVASKMGSITDMKEMAKLEKQYSQMSDELEKYNNAMMLTKEWAEELVQKEKEWEESVRPDNEEALRSLRRHMPVNIKDLSENDMINGVTPNGKQLPQNIVRKFKRTNILQLVRMPPSSIEPMHPSSLESMRSTGLTLTERRALHEHLKDLGAKWKAASNDKMAERKWMWHESLRGKFKELVAKHQQNPPRSSHEIDYSDDYGFPAEAVYQVESVKKSNLLTMEELERRKSEDEWGGPTQEEEEATQTAAVGMMTPLGSSSQQPKKSTPMKAKSMPARPKMGGGLLAAIASKGSTGNDDSEAPSSQSGGRPKMGGGLLAAIAAKGGKGSDDSETPTAPSGERPKMGGGLLAAIQQVEKEKEAKIVTDSVPTPAPPAKTRSGGLLAAMKSTGGSKDESKEPSDSGAPSSSTDDVGDDDVEASPSNNDKRRGLLAGILGRRKK